MPWQHPTRLFPTSRPEHEAVTAARRRVETAIAEWQPAHVVLLVSGGKDSMVLWDTLADMADHIGHINTGIGLAVTTQFVHNEAARRGNSLIVVEPDTTYEELVVNILGGFPGPAMHRIAYQRLKERAVRKLRRQLQEHTPGRVMLLTGIRMDESRRRMVRGASQVVDVEGSTVWVNPLLDWTNEEMSEYRTRHNLRISPAYEHIHISGECLCGAFGSRDELAQLKFFYGDDPAVQRICALEDQLAETGSQQPLWGNGSPNNKRATDPGRLCSMCPLPGIGGDD